MLFNSYMYSTHIHNTTLLQETNVINFALPLNNYMAITQPVYIQEDDISQLVATPGEALAHYTCCACTH